jgi:hypothetical protein
MLQNTAESRLSSQNLQMPIKHAAAKGVFLTKERGIGPR